MPEPEDDRTIVIEISNFTYNAYNPSDFKIEIHDYDVESYDDELERNKDKDGQEYVIISL